MRWNNLFFLGIVGLVIFSGLVISVHHAQGQMSDPNLDSAGYKMYLPMITKGATQTNHPIEENVILADWLAISLTLEKSTFEATESILLRFTMTNSSPSTLYFLKWGTPLEGFKKDMFIVTRQDVRIPYTGMLVKRGEPVRESYVAINAGEYLSAVIDLAEGYAIQQAGQYTIEFTAGLPDVRREEHSIVAQAGLGQTNRYNALNVRLPPINFVLTNDRAKVSNDTVLPATFTNCTATEQQIINTAFQSAQTLASNALAALQNSNTPTQAARYITWFGAHTTGRYSTVQNHFSAISNAFNTQGVAGFDWVCNPAGCDPGTFAYVFPDQPYRVHLCSSFWSAGSTGTDSRPGVLIHETSHFNVAAATDDNEYGYNLCINLAQTTPTSAIDNADSHEYFAENVQSLPMGPMTNPVRVRFSHGSTELGTFDLPYNSVDEGVSAVASGGVLQIEAGSTTETFVQIAKPMTIRALNGTVTIGRQ